MRQRIHALLHWLSKDSSVFELIDEADVYQMALERYEAQVRLALEEFITATNGRRKGKVIQMRKVA